MGTDFVSIRCLPDVPGGCPPIVWRSSMWQANRRLKNGWNLDIACLPAAVKHDLQRRVEHGAMHIYRRGEPYEISNMVCLATPDVPNQAGHTSNALALLASTIEALSWGVGDRQWLYSGSFGADGTLLPISNPIQLALEAKKLDCWLVVERSSAEIVKAVWPKVYGLDTACDLWDLIHKSDTRNWEVTPRTLAEVDLQSLPDMGDVIGQQAAKTALEIAVAGRHPLLMLGSPGAGKSLLASCIPGISPPLTDEEKIEVAQVWQAAGKLEADQLPHCRPIRMIDNNITKPALLGGGSDQVYPGEVSLAHRGVLYIDEMLTMTRSTLEALRSPMQDGSISISRTGWKAQFPADFQLVASANPCPCSYWDEDDPSKCTCTKTAREHYQAKLSGAVFDRIHIVTHLKRPNAVDTFLSDDVGESSSAVAERVASATKIQYDRQGKLNGSLSAADLPGLRQRVKPEALGLARERDLSMRGLTNVIKLGLTISDIRNGDMVEVDDIKTALWYSQKSL